MGIGKPTLNFLLAEHRLRPFSGTVLTLGRQDIRFSKEYLAYTAKMLGINLLPVPMQPSSKPELAARGAISDESLFRALGCSSLRALDVSPYEGAEIIWNLNQAGVPEPCRGAFDIIFDGGTLEHVFHLPNALANLHEMVSVGGRIIHALPLANYVDHGFYMFSPTFFCDYYAYNGYVLNQVLLHRIERWDLDNEVGRFIEYNPTYFRNHQPGGIDGAVWNLFVAVTRRPEAVSGKVPQQGYHYGLSHRC